MQPRWWKRETPGQKENTCVNSHEPLWRKVDRSSYESGYGLEDGSKRFLGSFCSNERLGTFVFVCASEKILIRDGILQEDSAGRASKKIPASTISEDSQQPKRQLLQSKKTSSDSEHDGQRALEDEDPVDEPGVEAQPVIVIDKCGLPEGTADPSAHSSSRTVASTVHTRSSSSSQPNAASENRSKHIVSDTTANGDTKAEHTVQWETRLTSSISRLIMKQRELIRSSLKNLAARLEPVRDKPADEDTLRRQKTGCRTLSIRLM